MGIEAIFRPKQTDNLRPEVRNAIGKKLSLRYLWTADSNEQFAGQKIYGETEMKHLEGYWIPEEDLNFI